MAASKRIIGLDIIRSVAILSVMTVHFFMATYHKYPLILGICGMLAVFGVELFFVLSGFLIGGILIRDMEDGEFDLHAVTHFWKRRWFRTLPNYYLFLLINIAIMLGQHKSEPDLYKYFFFWQNMTKSYDSLLPYAVSWSLCLEEWAYLLLPICCLALMRLIDQKKNAVLYAILIFLTLPLISRIIQVHEMASWDATFRKGVIYHIDGIFVGVGLAFIARYYVKLFQWASHKITFCLAFILLSCLGGWLIFRTNVGESGNISRSMLINVFYLNAVDFSILFIIAFFSTIKSAPAWVEKPFIAVSTYSYGLYLCHPVAMFVSYALFNRFFTINKLTNMILIVMQYVLSFIIAMLVYHLYEKRITRLREKPIGFNGKLLSATKA